MVAPPSFAWDNLWPASELWQTVTLPKAERPSVDETKGDSVGANTERTPFLGNSFGKTDDCRLGGRIVGLTNVTVKARG